MVCKAPVWLNLVEKRSVKYLDLYSGSCHKRKKTNAIFISRQLALPVQWFMLSGVAAGCCQPSQQWFRISESQRRSGLGISAGWFIKLKVYIWIRPNYFEMSNMQDDEAKLNSAFWINQNKAKMDIICTLCVTPQLKACKNCKPWQSLT